MTRRRLLSVALFATAAKAAPPPLIVPVHLVVDGRVKWKPEPIRRFWSQIWPQAVRDFDRGGIRIETTLATGGVERPPGREPVLSGLEHGVIKS